MPRCTSVRVNVGNKNKEGIVIKSIAGNHQALHTFCKLAQKTGHKLFYAGDRAGVVAYRFMQMLTVRKRGTIPEDITAALMEHQSNRCGACGDLLRKFENHHKQTVAAGGSDDINNLVFLCPACHASETEKAGTGRLSQQCVVRVTFVPAHAQSVRVTSTPAANTLGRRSGTLQGRL